MKWVTRMEIQALEARYEKLSIYDPVSSSDFRSWSKDYTNAFYDLCDATGARAIQNGWIVAITGAAATIVAMVWVII